MKSSQSLPFNLALKNALRMVQENLAAWGILVFIYSFVACMIIQTVVVVTRQGNEMGNVELWLFVMALAVIPGLMMKVVLPAIPMGIGSTHDFFRLYIRHRLRKLHTWFFLTVCCYALVMIPDKWIYFSVLLVQIPISAEIFWIFHWRELMRVHSPRVGAMKLVTVFIGIQTLQAFIILLALFLTGQMGWHQALACLAAVIGATAVVMEGDSGRPVLVNLISLGSGTLWGGLTLWSPYWFPVVIYFAVKMVQGAHMRLHSLERIDQDVVIP